MCRHLNRRRGWGECNVVGRPTLHTFMTNGMQTSRKLFSKAQGEHLTVPVLVFVYWLLFLLLRQA